MYMYMQYYNVDALVLPMGFMRCILFLYPKLGRYCIHNTQYGVIEIAHIHVHVHVQSCIIHTLISSVCRIMYKNVVLQ